MYFSTPSFPVCEVFFNRWPHISLALQGRLGGTARAAPRRKNLQSKQAGAAARHTTQKEMTQPGSRSTSVAGLGIKPRAAARQPRSTLGPKLCCLCIPRKPPKPWHCLGLAAQKADKDADWRAARQNLLTLFQLWEALVMHSTLRRHAVGKRRDFYL